MSVFTPALASASPSIFRFLAYSLSYFAKTRYLNSLTIEFREINGARMKCINSLDEANSITQGFDLRIVCLADIIEPVEELSSKNQIPPFCRVVLISLFKMAKLHIKRLKCYVCVR